MNKILTTLAVIAGLAIAVIAQDNIGKAYTVIGETSGTTNYLGLARTTENSAATPSTSNAVWKIIRTITDSSGNVTSVNHAYGSGEGDLSLWSTAWTNRVSATYK